MVKLSLFGSLTRNGIHLNQVNLDIHGDGLDMYIDSFLKRTYILRHWFKKFNFVVMLCLLPYCRNYILPSLYSELVESIKAVLFGC